MPAPADARMLLKGPPEGVNADAYFKMGAENRWAHLRGFKEFIHACVLKGGFKSEQHALGLVRSALGEAVTIVPKRWKESFKQGDWEVCHVEQVTWARKGPVRFDKACVVLLATDIACKRKTFGALNALDIFEHVTLQPAIYKLVGMEKWHTLFAQFPARLKPGERVLIDEILHHLLTCCPRDTAIATIGSARSFLSQALEGRAMTWENAKIVSDAFNEPVFGKPRNGEVPGQDCLSQRSTVEMTDGRSDGGKFKGNKHCNQSEAPFVTLSEKELDALRKAVERSAKAARH